MTQKRPHKILSHYGVSDYYADYKRNSDSKMDRKTYSSILTSLLSELMKAVIKNNYMLKLPHKMGTVILLKRSTRTEFVDGKMKTNRPIDYAATNKLWEERPDLKEQKKVIYHENKHSGGYVFRLSYLKSSAVFKNKSVYWMQMNRTMKRMLKDLIVDNKVDALLK